MSEFKKPVGLPTYSQYYRSSQIPTERMTTPSQSEAESAAYRKVEQIIDNSEKKSDDPYFMEEEDYLEMMGKIIKRDFFPEKISEEEKQQLEMDPKISQLSLNDFVRKYKSEDNETFKKIMDREDEKWREKYWWMFLAEKKDRINQLALENGDNSEKDTIKRMILPNPNQPLAITNVESQSSMFFTPQYMPPAVIQKSNLDTKSREEKINYTNTRFNNDSIEEEQEKNVKSIVTRMVSDLEMQGLSTPFLLGMGYDDPTSVKHKHFRYNLEELMHGRNNQSNNEPKIINGYQIHSMPSPAPNQMDSPFITWGEIEDAPVKLNEKASFKIREVSDREKLASNMASNIQKTKAIQKKQNQELLKRAINSGTPLKVASILSSSHGNSLVKSILEKKLTGRSGILSSSNKTPQVGKISNQTPVNRQSQKLPSSSQSSNTSLQANPQQLNRAPKVVEETPLLKF